jgi:hypothetical protein
MARDRVAAHSWQGLQHAARRPSVRRAAGGQSGKEPQLSEEELNRMTEDFVKEVIEGAGADDPELKTYKSQVRMI